MRWIILIGILISVGCGKSDSSSDVPAPVSATAPANGLPTLVIDSEHQVRNETSTSKPYFVPAAAGLNLQIDGFAFRDPKNLGRSPNMIQVLYQKSAYAMPRFEKNASQIFTLDQS